MMRIISEYGCQVQLSEDLDDAGEGWMTFSSVQVNDQALLAAREFVVSWSSDTGEVVSGSIADRMRFSYEMGYLRGHGVGLLTAVSALSCGESSAGVIHTSEQARFAAREFAASWLRETGVPGTGETGGVQGLIVMDRIRLAYEMGYLRGHGAGLLTSVRLFQRVREET